MYHAEYAGHGVKAFYEIDESTGMYFHHEILTSASPAMGLTWQKLNAMCFT